jgi:hypothetical protein
MVSVKVLDRVVQSLLGGQSTDLRQRIVDAPRPMLLFKRGEQAFLRPGRLTKLLDDLWAAVQDASFSIPGRPNDWGLTRWIADGLPLNFHPGCACVGQGDMAQVMLRFKRRAFSAEAVLLSRFLGTTFRIPALDENGEFGLAQTLGHKNTVGDGEVPWSTVSSLSPEPTGVKQRDACRNPLGQ